MNTRKDVIEAANATAMAIMQEERFNLSEEDKGKIVKELKKALSDDRVRDEPHIVAFYRGAAFAAQGNFFNHVIPDIVVYPKNKEEVQQILSIASKYKVPVTITFSQNVSLANRPLKGGIVVVTSKMTKIHKIDTEHGYVVIEPGVTVAQLSEQIRPLGYGVAKGSYPASLSVVGTLAAWWAMHNMCNRMQNQVVGLEMVTPDGSTIYTGNMVYRDSEFWTDISFSTPQMTNLFIPQSATTGVITTAAIRIWPLLEETACPVFGFNDFESALKWSVHMGKSSMADTVMTWHWTSVGGTNFRKSDRYLDMMEARMNYEEHEAPENIGLYNCYGFVQMRGFKEEVEGALKSAIRVAGQYGGTHVPEEELQEKLPKFWSYISQWKDFTPNKPSDTGLIHEGTMNLQMITGPTDEIIKTYKDLNEKMKEHGYYSYGFYTRVFNGAHTPWFRYYPVTDSATMEDIQETNMIMDKIMDELLQKYDINVLYNDFMFNDPANPENVKERAKPIRRLMSAIQREFDPAGIMNPIMKKYTLK